MLQVFGPRIRRIRSVVAVPVVCLCLLAGCTSGDDSEEAAPPATSKAAPAVDLTLAVYGPAEVTDIYRELADEWSASDQDVEVDVLVFRDRARAMAGVTRLRAAGNPPDLFLADRDDLSMLDATGALRRVDDLLSARQIDFGDGYSRRGLEGFGQDAALQCMPVDVSPLVVYYNPQLVELDEVAEPGATEITQERGWRLEEFARAARQARSPGVRGLHIEPTLEQIAPFVWSGGGSITDDVAAPTSLTLSDDASSEAMSELLGVVRAPALTLSESALERQTAIERFEDGTLGMLLGYRDLTARFRDKSDLIFDVMPMPVIDGAATSGRLSGLCISADSPAQEQAADLLVALISTEAQEALAETGYVMPSNLDSLDSEAFLASGERPLHSTVFSREVRDIMPMPTSPNWAPVAAVASRQLSALFYDPFIDPLEDRLAAIDVASQPLLVTEDEVEGTQDEPSE